MSNWSNPFKKHSINSADRGTFCKLGKHWPIEKGPKGETPFKKIGGKTRGGGAGKAAPGAPIESAAIPAIKVRCGQGSQPDW